MRTPSAYLRLVAVPVLLASGCAQPAGQSEPESLSAPASGGRVVSLAHGVQPPPPDAPKDPPAAQVVTFRVDVFKLAVPFGTFAGNEDFWKRMDEQCVDPATNDLLVKNGIRVGQAALSELEFFKRFMEDKPLVSRLTTTGLEAQRVEIDMREELPAQTIFLFDRTNQLIGRDYDRCSNVINMSFQPAPRKIGQMRLTLAPMVRDHRKHYQVTQLNNDVVIDYVHSEMLYDLNLRVDIPPGRFFIVMPSREAEMPSSVGRAFLTVDGPTERQEQILLIVPYPQVAQAQPR